MALSWRIASSNEPLSQLQFNNPVQQYPKGNAQDYLYKIRKIELFEHNEENEIFDKWPMMDSREAYRHFQDIVQ